MKDKLHKFFIMTLGTLLVVSGIYFFKIPNNFSTGGVSGISVILGSLSKKFTASSFIFIINISLLFIGFLFVGKKFGIKTVYCSLLMSVAVKIFEVAFPIDKPLTNQPMLELIFAIVLPATGSALLFDVDASTGGTDIVAMIIKKFFSINISKALFIADFIIVMVSFVVFGIETWLFCVIGFLSKVFLVNTLLESINLSKYCTVITSPDYEGLIQSFITQKLHKSATISDAFLGAYGGEKKCVLLVALNRKQTVLLKKYVTSLDGKAFIVINNTSDICGRGFRVTV